MTPDDGDAVRTSALSSVRHHVDAVWCDASGVFAMGWAHVGDAPASSVYLRCGSDIAEGDAGRSRPDVQAAFPGLVSDRCGFSCYLACAPFRPVHLGVRTAHETIEFALEAVPVPVRGEAPPDDPLERFTTAMKQARGRVVEIGARAASPGATLRAGSFAPECTFIGVDIHAADGVDIVADAHYLSDAIPRNSVDGVFSLAVLEHLAAPWLVAAEINRILKVGGLTFHVVPQTWPVHAAPNDFWRISDDGLRTLFGTATGFDVLEAAMSMPMQIMPPPQMRAAFAEMPLLPGMGSSHIMSRKVMDLGAGAVRWPAQRHAMERQSASYPRDGEAC